MNSRQRMCALVLAAVVLAAACGTDDDPGATAPSEEVDTPEAETESEADVEEPEDNPVVEEEPLAEEEPAAEDEPVAEEPTVRLEVTVGALSSLSGPFALTDASLGATAVFDSYNADPDGLLTINYIVEDDAADPAVAAQVARKLVDADNIVMMAGSASLADCDVNNAFYEDNGIYSVPGTGISDACFSSPNVQPVNGGGASNALTTSLYYMSEVLGHDAICIFRFNAGNPPEPVVAAIDRWTALTGKTALIHDTYLPGEDFTPLVTKAVNAGCTAVFEGGLDFTAIAWDGAVAAQGATFVTFHYPSAFTVTAAEAIATPASDTYATSEFEPFSDLGSPALTDWLEAMNNADAPLNALGEPCGL